MAQVLLEVLGQRGIWPVNGHISALPGATARVNLASRLPFCCLRSSKPKPAVDLIFFLSMNWAVTCFAGVACAAVRKPCTTLQDWATPPSTAALASLPQERLPQN